MSNINSSVFFNLNRNSCTFDNNKRFKTNNQIQKLARRQETSSVLSSRVPSAGEIKGGSSSDHFVVEDISMTTNPSAIIDRP